MWIYFDMLNKMKLKYGSVYYVFCVKFKCDSRIEITGVIATDSF